MVGWFLSDLRLSATVLLPEDAGKFLLGELAKCLSVHEVDDEVTTGVTDQGQVVQAGQTEEPVGRDEEVRAAPLHLGGHRQLVAVEDDPGDVTTAEDGHDADGDQGAVDLVHHAQPAAAVRKSKSEIVFIGPLLSPPLLSSPLSSPLLSSSLLFSSLLFSSLLFS